MIDSKHDSDYSDDFEDSDDDNYSDEFETEPALLNNSLKTPIPPDAVNSGEDMKELSSPFTPEGQATAEDDYPDDFDDDSDAENVLDEILLNAKAAQEAEVVNDVIQDHPSPGLSRRHKLKQQMIGAFGEKVFEQVQKFKDDKGSQFESGTVEFEKLTGSEIME